MKGRHLNAEWAVNARHALYSERGTWYHLLVDFPGALFDALGYVLFETEVEYLSCTYLRRGKELNVPGGISRMPNYVRMR